MVKISDEFNYHYYVEPNSDRMIKLNIKRSYLISLKRILNKGQISASVLVVMKNMNIQLLSCIVQFKQEYRKISRIRSDLEINIRKQIQIIFRPHEFYILAFFFQILPKIHLSDIIHSI